MPVLQLVDVLQVIHRKGRYFGLSYTRLKELLYTAFSVSYTLLELGVLLKQILDGAVAARDLYTKFRRYFIVKKQKKKAVRPRPVRQNYRRRPRDRNNSNFGLVIKKSRLDAFNTSRIQGYHVMNGGICLPWLQSSPQNTMTSTSNWINPAIPAFCGTASVHTTPATTAPSDSSIMTGAKLCRAKKRQNQSPLYQIKPKKRKLHGPPHPVNLLRSSPPPQSMPPPISQGLMPHPGAQLLQASHGLIHVSHMPPEQGQFAHLGGQTILQPAKQLLPPEGQQLIAPPPGHPFHPGLPPGHQGPPLPHHLLGPSHSPSQQVARSPNMDNRPPSRGLPMSSSALMPPPLTPSTSQNSEGRREEDARAMLLPKSPEILWGKDCEQNIDERLDGICKNGGACIDLDGSFECTCSTFWEGRTCEQNINCNKDLKNRASEILNEPDQKVVVDNGQLTSLLNRLVARTDGYTVEHLEKIYIHLSQIIFRHRIEYDKSAMVAELAQKVDELTRIH